mmetsp:Transcript_4995/g.10738  ORF Transcript_4995/g.10738 Transcript_4995/m.10738 type:complete len:342 (-) Transcript_4995:74-1099(-)
MKSAFMRLSDVLMLLLPASLRYELDEPAAEDGTHHSSSLREETRRTTPESSDLVKGRQEMSILLLMLEPRHCLEATSGALLQVSYFKSFLRGFTGEWTQTQPIHSSALPNKLKSVSGPDPFSTDEFSSEYKVLKRAPMLDQESDAARGPDTLSDAGCLIRSNRGRYSQPNVDLDPTLKERYVRSQVITRRQQMDDIIAGQDRTHEELWLESKALLKTSPFDFWRKSEKCFMKRMARLCMSVPGSEVECERNFSLAGLYFTRLRRKLSVGKIKGQMFYKRASDRLGVVARMKKRWGVADDDEESIMELDMGRAGGEGAIVETVTTGEEEGVIEETLPVTLED